MNATQPPRPEGAVSASAQSDVLDPSRQRAVLIVLSAAALMVMYVETMIIPGLDQFRTFFGDAPLPTVTWILSAYLLVGVAFTPIAGKLGDIYGKKRVLVAILGVYFVAVTLAGFSPNIGDAFGMGRPNELYLLIGIRAVQGSGMAMFPLAFALIGEEFPKDRIARAQGLVSAMFSAGASIGLLGGAYLTQVFGWQFTYHTVVPVSLILLVLTIVLLRESRVKLRESIDVPGAAFLALGLTFFLVGLTEGPTWGWGNWSGYTIAGIPLGAPELFVLALVCLVAFVVVEGRSPRPIVQFSKLRERNILLANSTGFFAGIAMFLMFVGVVARAETPAPIGLGKTALDFGLYSIPTTVVNMISAPLTGRLIAARGPKPAMLIGSALLGIGGASLALFNATVPELIIGPIPILTGVITIYIAMTNLVVVSSRPGETGIQTGMNQTFRNLGTAIGPVLAATILASVTATFLITVGPGVTVPIKGPSTEAFQWIFALISALGWLALLLSSLLKDTGGVRAPTAVPRPAGEPGASPAR